MVVPLLHRADGPLARLGPFEPAQRYWHGNAPEYDIVARSLDGRRILVGEARWPAKGVAPVGWEAGRRAGAASLPGAADAEVVHALFVPDTTGVRVESGVEIVDAKTVMTALR